MESPQFYSKMLLFGEYSILHGSQALAVPFSKFSGKLRFNTSQRTAAFERQSNKYIHDFYTYLIDLCPKQFNSAQLQADIEQGLFFDSDIPQGYGLGSSAALVAAIYHSYFKKSTPLNKTLKHTFSEMEAFFHGKSSGFDPLVSYHNKTILINEVSNLKFIDTQNINLHDFFLIDSKIPRKTTGLVQAFQEKSTTATFKNQLKTNYLPFVDKAIENLLTNNSTELTKNIRKISSFQLTHFQKMIPNTLSQFWYDGLSSSDFTIKLCGAGGGGFFLAHTTQHNQFKAYFDRQNYNYFNLAQSE